MQKQICDDRSTVVIRRRSQPLKDIRFHHGNFACAAAKRSCRAVTNNCLSIHENDFLNSRNISQRTCKQCPIARSDIHHSLRPGMLQLFADHPRMSHERIDSDKVAPGTLRIRRLRGKFIEKLRLDYSRHDQLTFRNAPWQLKPAPNEHIHHKPPDAPLRNARSNT